MIVTVWSKGAWKRWSRQKMGFGYIMILWRFDLCTRIFPRLPARYLFSMRSQLGGTCSVQCLLALFISHPICIYRRMLCSNWRFATCCVMLITLSPLYRCNQSSCLVRKIGSRMMETTIIAIASRTRMLFFFRLCSRHRDWWHWLLRFARRQMHKAKIQD